MGARILTAEDGVPELAEALQRRELVFLFGAGLSAEWPATLPTADELTGALRGMLERAISGKLDMPRGAIAYLESIKLEALLNQFADVIGHEALSFYDILKPSSHAEYGPNARHYLLAILALHGFCRTFATVNFDTAMEEALKELGVQHVVPEVAGRREASIYRALDAESASPVVSVLKLHGTLSASDPLNSRLLATIERVGIGLPDYKAKALAALTEKNSTCILGYNYRRTDVDVFPILRAVQDGGRVYWHVRTDDPALIDKDVAALVARRGGFFFTGDLTDALLCVAQRVGLPQARDICEDHVHGLAERHLRQHAMDDQRRMELREFSTRYEARTMRSGSVGRLMLAAILQRPGFFELSKTLNDIVTADLPLLKPEHCYAYYTNLAENRRNVGQLGAAVDAHRQALDVLASVSFDPSRRDFLAAREHIRIASEQIGCAKATAKSMLRKPRGLISATSYVARAARNLRQARVLTSRARVRMDDFERSTLLSMMSFEVGDFFQAITEGGLFMALHLRKRGKAVFAALAAALRVPAFLAELAYRHSVAHFPTQASSWYFFQLHRMLECRLLRTRRVDRIVPEILERARTYFSWNAPEGEASYVPASEGGSNLVLARALMLIYENNRNCVELLQTALRDYRSEKHLSGIFKALLYTMLWYERQGDVSRIRSLLQDARSALAGYQTGSAKDASTATG